MNVPQLIDLQRVDQPRGRLAIGELGAGLPFRVERFFVGYDIPRGEIRGAHAHRRLEQLLVCVAGVVRVSTHDGRRSRAFMLDCPLRALYIPQLVWAEQEFSPSARLIVLCSERYDESDYIRDRAEFDRITAAAA